MPPPRDSLDVLCEEYIAARAAHAALKGMPNRRLVRDQYKAMEQEILSRMSAAVHIHAGYVFQRGWDVHGNPVVQFYTEQSYTRMLGRA